MPTIGVAIAVPEPYGEQLRRHRASFGDPRAAGIPTHVTLLPPTPLDPAELAPVEDLLDIVAAKHSPFDVHLRGTATFRPVSPVVFVALSEGISECELLAQSVRSELAADELRFPYHPHVTVAHDLPDDALDDAFQTLSDYDERFAVAAFALYVHDDTRGWVQARAFELRGDSG